MTGFSYPLLAREGYPHILIAGFAALIGTMMWGMGAIPLWLILLFVLQFFRDPKRTISDKPGVVVSPASGKVVAIGEEENPYLPGERGIRVSIFMNVFSVHSNLIPVAGTITGVEYFSGKFLNAALDKASLENERNAIHIETGDGHVLTCVQIAGLIARRILCYVESGSAVQTGERYGFIRFGSRVDVYLPLDSRVEVKLGQWVDSGNNVVGILPGY